MLVDEGDEHEGTVVTGELGEQVEPLVLQLLLVAPLPAMKRPQPLRPADIQTSHWFCLCCCVYTGHHSSPVPQTHTIAATRSGCR